MKEYKTLSALSYFSILFAPFLLPIIVFLSSTNEDVKKHAKRAILSHILPIAAGVLVFIFFIFSIASSSSSMDINNGMFYSWIIVIILYGVFTLLITVWNVVQGIRVLR